ncbi:MAG: hypothetical protein AAF738_04220 [Bacteroidota bacterium]
MNNNQHVPIRKVRNLKELRMEKARLKSNMAYGQSKAFDAFEAAKKKAPAYALKKVAPPIVLAALSVIAARKGNASSNTNTASAAIDTKKKKGFGAIVLSLVSALLKFWLKKNT